MYLLRRELSIHEDWHSPRAVVRQKVQQSGKLLSENIIHFFKYRLGLLSASRGRTTLRWDTTQRGSNVRCEYRALANKLFELEAGCRTKLASGYSDTTYAIINFADLL